MTSKLKQCLGGLMGLTSSAAGSGPRAEAGHRGRPTLAALQAALQYGLHVLVFSCIFSRLDTLRLALLRFGRAKFTALEEGGGGGHGGCRIVCLLAGDGAAHAVGTFSVKKEP